MPTLVLIGSVLVLVAAVVVVLARRRVAPPAAPAGPRTVADLVALRAEQSAARDGIPPRGSALRDMTDPDLVVRHVNGRSPTDWEAAAWQRPAAVGSGADDPGAVPDGASPGVRTGPDVPAAGGTAGDGPASPRVDVPEPAAARDAHGEPAAPRPPEPVADRHAADARVADAPVHVRPTDVAGDGTTDEATGAPTGEREPAEQESGEQPQGNDLPTPPAGIPMADPSDTAEVRGDAPWDRAALMRLKQRGPRNAGVIAAALLPSALVTPLEPEQPGPPPAAVEPAAVEPAAVEPAAVEPVAVGPVVPSVAPVAVPSATVEPSDAESAPAGPFAPRPRRSDEDTAAERAAADRGLNRTFGVPDERVPLVSARPVPVAEVMSGAPRSIRFRTVTRDGSTVPGATVTLLDQRGLEIANGVADGTGRGELRAPGPGGFVLVSAAPGHQPGAVAVTVAGTVLDTDVLLVRSATLSGSVYGEDGPILGAKLALVQDGEVVEAVDTAVDGAYRMADLAAGDYELAVTADGCEPSTVPIEIPDAADLRHDVDLDPLGLPGDDGLPHDDLLDDLMIGHR